MINIVILDPKESNSLNPQIFERYDIHSVTFKNIDTLFKYLLSNSVDGIIVIGDKNPKLIASKIREYKNKAEIAHPILLLTEEIDENIIPFIIDNTISDINILPISEDELVIRLITLIRSFYNVIYPNQLTGYQKIKEKARYKKIYAETNQKLDMVKCNKAFIEFFQIDIKNLHGKNIFEAVFADKHEAVLTYDLINERLKNNEDDFSIESVYTDTNGDVHYLEWNVEIIFDADKKFKVQITIQRIGERLIKQFYLHRLNLRMIDINMKETDKLIINPSKSGGSDQHGKSEHYLAKAIQVKLIPNQMPVSPYFRITASYIPIDFIGGDFYDIWNKEYLLKVMISNSTGTGINSALISSMIKVLFDQYAPRKLEPAELVAILSKQVGETLPSTFYLTSVILNYNAKQKLLKYCNCGHVPPIILRKENKLTHKLDQNLPPIGKFGDDKLNQASVYIKSGDRIVLYTDGIFNIKNSENKTLDLNMWVDILQKHIDKQIYQYKKEILTELDNFCLNGKINDDISIIIIDC